MIKLLAKLLKVLNSEAAPAQVALAVCLGMIAGLTPLMSLHNLLVLLLVLVLRINLAAFLLSLALFSGLAPLLDPLFHRTGLVLLGAPFLEGLWTVLYNLTIFRIERFYNTLILGSLMLALVFFYPVYRLLVWGIIRYRESVLAWVRKTRIMQAFKLSRFYRAYEALALMGDKR